MLSEEEKKAIDKLSSKKNETTWNDTIRQIKREEITDVVVTRQKYITTILNLIEKQQSEIEKQNKIIDKMAKSIYRIDAVSEYGFNTEDIIDYFTKLVEEELKNGI